MSTVVKQYGDNHRQPFMALLQMSVHGDKAAGGDGQRAEVALGLQCRRQVNLQEIDGDTGIAEKFPEKGIMGRWECFHWRTVMAPISTEYKRP